MEMLRIAVAKGKMLEETLDKFNRAGITPPAGLAESRKLVVQDDVNGFEWLLVRDQDVPAYVDGGAADIGVVGRDVLAEQESDLYQVLDLGIGACRLVLAARDRKLLERTASPKIATKFPNVTRSYFLKRGMSVSVIKLYGSVELAPLAGLADGIVDLVSTGQTLKENNLVIIDELLSSTGVLAANRVSLKMEKTRIQSLAEKLSRC